MTTVTAVAESDAVRELLPCALIADLKLRDAPDGTKFVQVLHGTTVGDGNGGEFYWSASSAATGDDFYVVVPTGHTGNGRWLRMTINGLGTVPSVVSIAALKAMAKPTAGSPVVTVASYYASATPDGGGGQFVWDSSSSDADNGGTIIAPDAGGVGRWRRIYSGAINVKWFGAKGDDVANDTTAISNAKSAATSGVPLYFPAGTYRNAATTTISAAGSVIVGDGWRQTKIKYTAAVNGLVVSEKYGRVSGIWFDGNSVGLTGLILHNSAETVFEDVYFGGWTLDGGRVNESFTSPTGNNNLTRLNRCNFNSNTGKGFTSPSVGLDGNGIEFIQCNMSSNTSHGLLIKGQAWRVVGGIYEGNGGYGIQISESGDASNSTGGLIFYPWVESNVSGGIRGGGKSTRYRVALDGINQAYTAAAGSEDLYEVIGNNAGPQFSVGDGVDNLLLTIVNAGTRRAQIQSTGTDANIPLYLLPKGTGGLHLDPFNNGGATLGGAGNAAITQHLSATAALDFDLSAVASQDLTIAVPGAALGDTVVIGVPNGSVTADTLFWGWVSATNTVTVRAMRIAGTPNPAGGTFRADVWKH